MDKLDEIENKNATVSLDKILGTIQGKDFQLISSDGTVSMKWKVEVDADGTYSFLKSVSSAGTVNLSKFKIKKDGTMWKIVSRNDNGVIKDNLNIPFAPFEGKVGVQAQGEDFKSVKVAYLNFFSMTGTNGKVKYKGPCLFREFTDYKIVEVYCAEKGYVLDQAGSTAFFGQP